jgi:RHS repeat-associated protein
MSNQSSSNNTTSETLSAAPTVTTFEFDNSSIGKIKNSVNLFRGIANIPIDLVKLPGRNQLDITVSALYSSSVKKTALNWNVEAPTSILGMGWDMQTEKIVVNKNNSKSIHSDDYYLLSGGISNLLIPVSRNNGDGSITFQANNYQFWKISYFPATEIWVILKEDGLKQIFGGADGANTLQYGVCWGNWMGNSAFEGGQQSYVLAWNLSTVVNNWGQSVNYAYFSVAVNVGSADFGLSYTRECYLQKITDSYGRTVVFNYADKFGAENPDIDRIEYQAENPQMNGNNAYQDRFETKYLDSVDVFNQNGNITLEVGFIYGFVNFGYSSSSQYPLYCKRILTGITQVSPNGKNLPGILFEYYTDMDDVNRGALKSIFYPQGGVATFNYTQLNISNERTYTVQAPVQGAIPRVWQGPDYTVVTWYQNGTLQIFSYQWNGSWIENEILLDPGHAIALDISTLSVIPRADFFSLSFFNTLTNCFELYLFSTDKTAFGSFYLSSAIAPMQLKSSSPATSIQAGNDFVVAYNPDFANYPFAGFDWSIQDQVWNAPLLPQVSGPSQVAFSCGGNYIFACCYNVGAQTANFQLIYKTIDRVWTQGSSWFSNIQVYYPAGSTQFPMAIFPSDAFAGVTFVTAVSATAISYQNILFEWDENYYVNNPSFTNISAYSSPIASQKPVYDIFRTFLNNQLVSNNPNVNRNIGGSTPVWVPAAFQTNTGSSFKFVMGEDTVLMQQEASGNFANAYLQFNPSFPESGWGPQTGIASGESPTIFARYFTIGNAVYFRDETAQWNQTQAPLADTIYSASKQQVATGYVVYQNADAANALTYVAVLGGGGIKANEALALPQGWSGQKCYVDEDTVKPGTGLAGADNVVTFPASGNFDSAAALTFNWINMDGELNGAVYDTPVNYLQIDDMISPQPYLQAYLYERSDESLVSYNDQLGLSQFPKVTVVAGTKDASIFPRPNGYTTYHFSNGVSDQGQVKYPVDWIYNYNQLLNGSLLAKYVYDNNSQLVNSQVYYWKVYMQPDNWNIVLYNAYFRLTQVIEIKDGVQSSTLYTYDDYSGIESSHSNTYFDSLGNPKIRTAIIKFAWQVPQYAQSLLAINDYSSVAQRTTIVSNADGSSPNCTESTVTTWQSWATADDDGERTFGDWQTYKFREPGSAAPGFDFSQPEGNPGWLKYSEIVSRLMPEGLVSEQYDIDNQYISYIYDTAHQYKVAEFPNASIGSGQASYYSFEDYEDADSWDISSGAVIIPNPADPVIDAHSGRSSLKISPASGQALSRSFSVTDAGQYVFSCFVKLPDGFDVAQGEGRVIITSGTVQTYAFTVPAGSWQFFNAIIDAGNLQQITISIQNNNTTHYLLIDNLRFSPLSSLMGAVAYDTDYYLVDCALGANGETSRKVYDDFQRILVSTNLADNLSGVNGLYFSRQNTNNVFLPATPNQKLTVSPATTNAVLDTFKRDNEWQNTWQPGGSWAVTDGILAYQTPGVKGTLTLNPARVASSYLISLWGMLDNIPQYDLGIQLGSNYCVQWNSLLNTWQLLDNAGNVLQSYNPKLFSATIPTAYSPTVASLREIFNHNGYTLTSGCSIQVTGDKIALTDRLQHFTAIIDGSQITIYQFNEQWILLVTDTQILFYADGAQVIACSIPARVSGGPVIFTSDPLNIKYLACGEDTRANIVFQNGAGNDVQSQTLSGNNAAAIQIIYDSLGRPAVTSKTATIPADPGGRILQYNGNLAQIPDWTTAVMTGLVADQNLQDGGYAYNRQVYESNPLSRLIEKGSPGTDLRISSHSEKIAYAGNSAQGNLPANQYYQVTTTDANGDITITLFNQLNTEIAKSSQKQSDPSAGFVRNLSILDDAQNPVILQSPNYFNPPPGSVNTDWEIQAAFDYQNRLIELTTCDSGTDSYIYNNKGRVRFKQNQDGADNGYYNYFKYDVLGRLIEQGFINSTWNRIQLTKYAQTDPGWPATPLTWRKKLSYDIDTNNLLCIGKITAISTNNGLSGDTDTTEIFAYDLNGNVTAKSQSVAAYDNQAYVTGYVYNNFGQQTEIQYPQQVTSGYTASYYSYNALNQLAGIGSAAGSNDIVVYTYGADGKPLSETYGPNSSQPIKRTFSYNSPVWLESIDDVLNTTNQALFSESLSYFNNPAGTNNYYNGQPAAAAYQVSGAGYNFNYAYNALGAQQQAVSAQKPGWSIGAQTPVQYDDNGNCTIVQVNSNINNWAYGTGNQRLISVTNATTQSPIGAYGYNGSGFLKSRESYDSSGQPVSNLQFTYDPGFQLTQKINDSITGATSTYVYGGGNNRVLKTYAGTSGSGYKKLYVNGIAPSPVVELVDNGQQTIICQYIYGLQGLVAMVKNNKLYHVLKDHLGSVRMAVDEVGVIAASYNYSAFGLVEVINEISENFIGYLFTGQEYEQELGIYNFKARFYDPNIGRFYATDELRQYFSPYIYAANNPVLFIDPSGKFSIGNFFSAIAGFIVGAIEIVIGIIIDVVAAIAEVLTGGLATPVAVALASVSGLFIGAGISAVSYSSVSLFTNEFSWKDYGINMGIGAAAGVVTAGFGAVGSVASEAATGVEAAGTQATTLAKAANFGVQATFNAAGGAAAGGISTLITNAAHDTNLTDGLGQAFFWGAISGGLSTYNPVSVVKPGWGEMLKRIAKNVAYNEVSGLGIGIATNVASGQDWNQDLINTAVNGLYSSSAGAVQLGKLTSNVLKGETD